MKLICCACARIFNANDLIQIDDVAICEECLTEILKSLKELTGRALIDKLTEL